MKTNKVAIIGAGPCGLTAAKYAKENGLEPIIFEKSDKIGGQWSTSVSNPTAVWDGLYANLSYFSMSFSDLTYQKGTSIIPSFKEVHSYLLEYAKKFNIFEHINLETKVETFKHLENKKWQLETVSLKYNEKKIHTFDFLIIATGLHTKPRIPSYQNVHEFKGVFMHSSKYKLNDDSLKSKKVVVIGNSYSATDIAASLVGHASQILSLFKRPYLVSSRLMRLKSDLNQTNQFNIIPNDFFWFNRAIVSDYTCKTPEELFNWNKSNLSCINYDQTELDRIDSNVFFDFNDDIDVKVSISDNYIGYIKQGKFKNFKLNFSIIVHVHN